MVLQIAFERARRMPSDDFDEETKVPSEVGIPILPATDRDRAYLIVLTGASVGEMFKLTKDVSIIGRSEHADVRMIDDGVSRNHARLVRDGDRILLQDLGATNGTFCNGTRIKEHVLSDGDKIQVGSTTILKFTFHDQLDESFQKQMYESALLDGLTKIFNKKYFLDRLDADVAYAGRHGIPLSLLMLDVDHFKEVNDTRGHLAGDHVLSTLAAVVSATVRKEDVLARYGGEEFAVICKGIDVSGARAFADRLRLHIESTSFICNGSRLPITVSIGAATIVPPPNTRPSAAGLIALADGALYQAKRAGRNRVVAAGPAVST
jgi:two-component system, cell cycle response regulator